MVFGDGPLARCWLAWLLPMLLLTSPARSAGETSLSTRLLMPIVVESARGVVPLYGLNTRSARQCESQLRKKLDFESDCVLRRGGPDQS